MRTRLQTQLVSPLQRAWQRATSSRKRRRLGVGVAIVALGLLAAACGGAASSSSSTTTTTKSTTTPTSSSSSSGTASETAFRSCLEKNGVTPTSGGSAGAPTPGAGAASGNPNFQQALQACASLRPKGAGSGFGGNGGANSTAVAAYRNCLTLHGVSLPSKGSTSTTTTIAGATATTLPSVSDTSNPTVEAALSACASLKPTTTSGKSPSSSTTAPSS
jgi:hypothetical protein